MFQKRRVFAQYKGTKGGWKSVNRVMVTAIEAHSRHRG